MRERNRMPKDWRSRVECPTCKGTRWSTVEKRATFRCRSCGFKGAGVLVDPLKDWTFWKPEPRVDPAPVGVDPAATPAEAQGPAGGPAAEAAAAAPETTEVKQ